MRGAIQAFAALLGAALTVGGCYALGALLIDRIGATLYRAERAPLAFVLGASCLHLAVFLAMALRIAYAAVVIAIPAAAIIAAIVKKSFAGRDKELPPLNATLKMFSAVLFAAFGVLYFFHAWAPESSPDGSGYHLGLVARYVRAHGFERITTSIFAMLSGGVDLLFVPAFAVGRHSAAALVHLAFAGALALGMIAYGRRLGKPWAGAAGAFLTFAAPVVGINGSSAYNDVAVAAIVFSVFCWLELWDGDRRTALLIPVGLLAGYAYAAKYTAFVMFPFAVTFVALRGRFSRDSWRGVAVVAGCAALMAGPWILKNWISVQNPFAPFANRVFRNPYVHPMFEQDLSRAMRSYGVQQMRTLPLEVTVRGDKTQGVIGPAFLLATISLLALRERPGRRLLAAGGVLLAVYFTNIGTRFLIPVLPFVSLAMAMALDRPGLLAMLMVFHAVTSWPGELRHYASQAWRLDRVLYKQALRIIPQDRYLRENFPPYGAARMIEAMVPSGERVFATTGVPQAYTSREILIGYESAFNQTLADSIENGWSEVAQPRVWQDFKFAAQSVRRVRVLRTAPPADTEWSIHELRFYHRGAELARNPAWRLTAWPNPWEVRIAFDNSPATRWRSGEPARPGMYIDVDFGGPQMLDEVRIEGAYETAAAQARIEAGGGGRWQPVAASVAVRDVEPPEGIRHAATYELAARGVHYLLVDDRDSAASQFHGDPESWHLEEIAAGYGMRLYRITW